MIRKVYEVDPMICSKCGGRMKVVVFITESGEYFYRPHMLFGLGFGGC